jgi:hypothetical protein
MSVRVRFEQVDDLPVDELVTMDARPDYNLPEGVGIGYRCRECHQADESIREIQHRETCSLREQFRYDTHDSDAEVFRAALHSDHEFLLVQAGETHNGHGYRRGEVVFLWCCECSNGDEELAAIEHSEVCSLARHNLGVGAPQPQMAADGGRPSDE